MLLLSKNKIRKFSFLEDFLKFYKILLFFAIIGIIYVEKKKESYYEKNCV